MNAEASDFSIPLSMINAFVYCPRRFYYEFVEGSMVYNEHVEEGRLRHKRIDDEEGKTSKKEGDSIHTRSVFLSSGKYGINGKIDLLEEKGGIIYPVEYKKRKTPKDNDNKPFVWLNDQVQLCCQALLLEDNGFLPMTHGFLYYIGSKKRVQVNFTEELLKTTVETIEAAIELAMNGHIPSPLVDDPRCIPCSLVPICMPFETVALKDSQGTSSIRRIIPECHDGTTVYVQTQGSSVQKKGGVIVIKSPGGDILEEIPLIHIQQMVIIGYVSVSTQTLDAFFSSDIPISYVSTQGRFKGIATGIPSKNSILRMAQYRYAHNREGCLSVAKGIVYAKTHNMRVMLMRVARGDSGEVIPSSNSRTTAKAADCLKGLMDKVNNADSLGTLLGLEGLASKEYFAVFQEMIRSDTNEEFIFNFEGRNRRPPLDPVNALLSFAYSLLSKDCFSACLTVGFDPFIGFYHQSKYGRPSLALDLMEEFRPIIGDSIVLTLINNRMVGTDDFIKVTGGACYLNEKGRKKFFEVYENRKQTLVTHPVFNYKISYSRVIEMQARLFARVVTGEIPEYVGFKVR